MYGGEWENMIAPVNKLYKSSLFKKVRFPDGRYFEDAATTNLLLDAGSRIGVLKSKGYFYYVTPNSSSVTKRSIELQDREWALRSHWEHFFAQGRKEMAYLALPFYLVELISIYHRIKGSDRPQDCGLIRKRFETTYRKYRRRITFTEMQEDQILAFRHPVLYDIRNMVRKDGVLKTLWGFVERKLGKADKHAHSSCDDHHPGI